MPETNVIQFEDSDFDGEQEPPTLYDTLEELTVELAAAIEEPEEDDPKANIENVQKIIRRLDTTARLLTEEEFKRAYD